MQVNLMSLKQNLTNYHYYYNSYIYNFFIENKILWD